MAIIANIFIIIEEINYEIDDSYELEPDEAVVIVVDAVDESELDASARVLRLPRLPRLPPLPPLRLRCLTLPAPALPDTVR